MNVNILVLLPPMIVEVLGAILALVWWRRHPRVSLVFLLAVGLFILTNIVGALLLAWLPQYLQGDRQMTAAATHTVVAIVNVARSFVVAVAWVLLLFAVFSGRSQMNKAG